MPKGRRYKVLKMLQTEMDRDEFSSTSNDISSEILGSISISSDRRYCKSIIVICSTRRKISKKLLVLQERIRDSSNESNE